LRSRRRKMKKFIRFAWRLSTVTQVIASLALVFMLVLTLSEVVLRFFGKPIIGSYELISFTGGIIIGLGIPYTTWMRGHVFVDSITNTFGKSKKDIIDIVTRCLGIILFVFLGWNFITMGVDLFKTNEVSTTLHLPFYPVAWGIGVSCFIQCLLLSADIMKIRGGSNE
jgi:TRAP-type C4-dicarboxylate transport system permease small subunit